MLKAVITAIISGLFSLAGIWLQNYLSRKNNSAAANPVPNATAGQRENSPAARGQTRRSQARIFFTILIAGLPWLLWRFFLFGFRAEVYNDMPEYAKIMAVYFLIWIAVTIVSLASGWGFKTLFEKFVLFLSAAALVYWELWMIIVHHLF